MCSNYRPVTRLDRLLTFFGVEYSKEEVLQRDVFPLGMAPFIRLSVERQEAGRPALVADEGMFGLLPHFAAEEQYGRRTYNARSETVSKLPSFRPSWEAGQRCIVPAEAVFEPSYETGKSVRWRIFQEADVPFGIAGLYRRWRNPKGGQLFTFTMLTVNADQHPFYKRFHKPGEEKRMPIFLDREEYGPWLMAEVAQAPAFFKMHPGPFQGEPAPLARGPKVVADPASWDEFLPPKAIKKATPLKAEPPIQDDLF